jgi:hypothetical protein
MWAKVRATLALTATGIPGASSSRSTQTRSAAPPITRSVSSPAAEVEATIKLLKLRKRGVNYRALITVYDSSTNTRTTLGGANFRIDPESTLSVPSDFGIAGEAFVNNRCAYGNVTDGERGRDSSGTFVAPVWKDVRSVVAFPLAPLGGRKPTGTVNFDSDRYLSDAGLDGRDPLDALSDVADVISRLLTRKNIQ